MYRRSWLILLCTLVVALATTTLVLAQAQSFQTSPFIYKIKIAGCSSEPKIRSQTGFRVKDKKGIVTALHGVVGCKTINAEPDDSGVDPLNDLIITEVDIDRDMALLWSTELDVLPVVGYGTVVDPKSDDYKGLHVIGYPVGLPRQKPTTQITVTETTKLSNLISEDLIQPLANRGSPAIGIEVLSVEGHLLPGHSGAPLLNGADQVVGVGNGGLDLGVTEITWAIPWSAIKWTSVSDDASQPVSQLDVERLDKLEKDGSQALFVYPLPEAILESQRLASESQSILEKDPETAILVALKANEYAHTFESENALRDALNTPYMNSGMSLPMDQNLVEDLAFSPNGALLVTAGTENMGGLAKVWELDTGKLITTLHDRVDYLLTAKFLDDDRILTYSATGNMLIWDARTGQQIENFRTNLDMNELFVPRSDRLIAHRRFNQDNTAIIDRFDVYVGLYDITSGTLTHSISPPQNHSVMDALYENGVATLLLKDDTEELIRIGFYDFQNSAEPQLLPLDDTNTNQTRITFGRISQSGKLAAYGDNKGLIKVFDVASGQKVKELREHSDEILYLNFSLDNAWLVSSSRDKTTKVWDISTTDQSLFTVTTDELLVWNEN